MSRLGEWLRWLVCGDPDEPVPVPPPVKRRVHRKKAVIPNRTGTKKPAAKRPRKK